MNQQQALNDIRQIIRKHLPDKSYKIFLFGSRASGLARRFSDFDVGLEGPGVVQIKILSDIESDLEDSDIPYKVEVVDFANLSSSFRNLAEKRTLPM